MIYAKITIKEVNYRKSFHSLLPVALEKCAKMENPNPAVRFFLKLGDAAMPVVSNVVNRMEEKSRDEFLCGLVNLYRREISALFNRYLQEDALGRSIAVGELFMAQDSAGQLSFAVRDLSVNYSDLMKNELVLQKIGDYADKAVKKTAWGKKFDLLGKVAADGAGLVANVAAGMMPNELEKQVLAVMRREENKGRLMKMAEEALAERGLYLSLKDIVFVQELAADRGREEVPVEEKQKLELSPELANELTDAVAWYLRSLLQECEELKEEERYYHYKEALRRVWNRTAEENRAVLETEPERLFPAMKIALHCNDKVYRWGLLAMEEFVDGGCGMEEGEVPSEEFLKELTRVVIDLASSAGLGDQGTEKAMVVFFRLKDYKGCEALQSCIYLMSAVMVLERVPADEVYAYFRLLVPEGKREESDAYFRPTLEAWKKEREAFADFG